MYYIEGKSCITDVGYYELVRRCRELHKEDRTVNGRNRSIFGWAWLTLQWNLLCRTSSVMDIHLEHLDWAGDCLKVTFAKSKGKQSNVQC